MRPYLEARARSAAMLHSSKPVREDWDSFDNEFNLFNTLVHLYRSNANNAEAGLQVAINERQETRGQMKGSRQRLETLAVALFGRMHDEFSAP